MRLVGLVNHRSDGLVYVNPDRVAFLRPVPLNGGGVMTEIYFSALHEGEDCITSASSPDVVAQLLQSRS